MDAKEIQEKIDILQKEVSTVIKGKDEVIRKVIMAILASGHVLLEDVPGLGKTTHCESIFQSTWICKQTNSVYTGYDAE